MILAHVLTVLLFPAAPPPIGTGPAPMAWMPRMAWQPACLLPDLYLARPSVRLARLTAKRVRLSWDAVPETRTQGYQVERSPDGSRWVTLGYLPVQANHRYRFEDTATAADYYRVARLDFSRQYAVSPAVRSTGTAPAPLTAHPNPAHGEVQLRGRDPDEAVNVVDSRGEVVRQISDSIFSTTGLTPGVYALCQGRQITRLVVR